MIHRHLLTVGAFVALAASLALTAGPTAAAVPAGPAAAPSTGVVEGPAWPGPHQVALTFDDGPSQYTQSVLDELAARGVHATFFVVGDSIKPSTAPLLAAMASAGDSVQNHTRTHPMLAKLPNGKIAAELSVTSDRVEQANGIRPSCFRPPYGSTSPRVVSVAAQQGLTQVTWNVDTSDYQRPGAGVIAARALANADGRPLTILMHDGGGNRSQTVAAIGTIIDGLRARGYEFVTLCAHAAAGPAGAQRVDAQPPVLTPVSADPSGLVPLPPVRVYDSRRAGQRLPAGSVIPIDLTGRVPAGTVAAAVDLTADAPAAAGFLSVVDCETKTVVTSAVNYARGAATASGAIAALDQGRLCVATSASAQVIVDLTGAFTPASTLGVLPTQQVRLLDTRSTPGRLRAGTVTRVPVPAGTAAVFANFTAVDAAATGFLTAWPCDTEPPATSVLNYSVDRQAVAAGALIGAGADGLCIANSAAVNVLVDVLAVFGDDGAPLRLLEPARVLDTRSGIGGWRGRVAPDQVIDVMSGLPAGAEVIGTLTATDTTGPGFVSLSPDEQASPTTSNLNVTSSDVANLTLVGTAADARFRATVGGRATALVFDVVGWFEPI